MAHGHHEVVQLLAGDFFIWLAILDFEDAVRMDFIPRGHFLLATRSIYPALVPDERPFIQAEKFPIVTFGDGSKQLAANLGLLGNELALGKAFFELCRR